MKKEHMIWLQENYACATGVIWIQEHNIKSLQEAWNVCNRGEWLLWMAKKLGVDERKLTLCAALCAHTVVQHMEDPRSREAIRVAFLWGRGKATDEQLMAARDAARYAKARYHSEAAARQAAAAWFDAAIWSAAAAAGGPDNGADDREANQLRTARIARKVLTEDVMEKIKEVK